MLFQRRIFANAALFDWRSYVNQYRGLSRVKRLRAIALCNQIPDRIEAKRLLHTEIKNGLEVDPYNDFFNFVDVGSDREFNKDDSISQKIAQRAQNRLQKINEDLTSYKLNLARDSLRVTQNDLGEVYLAMEMFGEASNNFTKAQGYNNTDAHENESLINLLRTALFERNHDIIINLTDQAQRGNFDLNYPEAQQYYSIIKVALAIDAFRRSDFLDAARYLIRCYESIGDKFNEFFVPSDIARLGAICVLATFERDQIRDNVIKSTSFQSLLQTVPEMKEAIDAFYNRDFLKCLYNIESQMIHLVFDPIVGKSLERLDRLIFERCSITYIQPYAQIDLNKMSKDLGRPNEELQNILVEII
ncbi:MAG: putative COP9 signalosome complex subunit, partial [Streblomastix strix]